MEGTKGAVCVTGGTGYIGSWLIMRLLEQGYIVHCTVRPDPEGQRDLSYLTNLPKASQNLKIFDADLKNPESFKSAIQNCVGVFHVAHPLEIQGKEPEDIASQRTVNASLGILQACIDSKSVQRVVYMSSATNVLFSPDKGCHDIVDESVWTDVEYCKLVYPRDPSYAVSKVITEKATIEFAEEHGLDLVTLIPPIVLGPFLCPAMPLSVRVGLALVLGNEDLYKSIINPAMVHVDDLVRALIHLFEYRPNGKGRYICASDKLTIFQMAEFFSTKYPNLPVPPINVLKEVQAFKLPRLSSKKLLGTGFKYQHGVDDMFDGAIQSCIERGFLKFGKLMSRN